MSKKDSKVLWERLESCDNSKIKMASHASVLELGEIRVREKKRNVVQLNYFQVRTCNRNKSG